MYSELVTLQNLQRFITLLADELAMVSRFKIVNTFVLDNVPTRKPSSEFRSYFSGTWLVEEPQLVRSKEELLI